MADESCRSAVLLICGIPASGKSTFTIKLQQYAQKTKGDSIHAIHVCYDDLIPSDLDVYRTNSANQLQSDLEDTPNKESVESGEGSPLDANINAAKYSLWKQFRKRTLEAVEKVVNMVQNNLCGDETDRSRTDVDEQLEMEGLPTFQEFWNIFQTNISRDERGCSCITSNDWRWNGGAHVILVDDNMFYHSMRYEYVQLARKYGAGFAEVFLKCPLEVAEKRNSLRSHPVAANTMRNMFSKMEPPEPEKFPWEQYSLIVKAEEELDVDTMESVIHLAIEALKHPVPQTVEDVEEKEKSRAACITSIVYQADQVLRKYTAKVIVQAKGSGKGKKELQSLARQLNKDKKTFLESLHNIKSHSKCDDRISKTVPSDERSKDSLLTGVEQENENVAEGNDTQGDDVNIINKNSHCGNSRSHLCLHCFPNVNDKEAFRLFVEELFKGTEHSQVSQTNK